MKFLINEPVTFLEAYDTITQNSKDYYNKVKEWFVHQDSDLATIDKEAKKYGAQALPFRTMLKFIESEQVIKGLNIPVALTLVNPLYKETGRMQRRDEHPHGENSLRTKIECIQHFENLNPHFSGRMMIVDDECPENSGKMATQIVEEYPELDHEVFFLGKAIEDDDPDLPPKITHKNGPNRSVKRWFYAIWDAKSVTFSKGFDQITYCRR